MVTSRPRARAPSIMERHSSDVAQARAVDVHDVQRSACDGSRSNYFADRLNRGAGLDAARAAHMGVDRHPPLGGQTEHVNHFQPSCSRRVLDAHPDSQAAGVKLGAQSLPHRSRFVRAWQADRSRVRS